MAQKTWTSRRRKKRRRDELERHEERRERRKAEALERGSEVLDLEDAEDAVDRRIARSRRVKDGRRSEVGAGLLDGLVVGFKRTAFVVALDRGGEIEARSRSTTASPHGDSTLVAVGDRVRCLPGAGRVGVIAEVLPRCNRLSRASKLHREVEQVMVANVDRVIVVASVRDPYLKPGLIDRYLLTALKHGIEARICFNKVDLDPERAWGEVRDVYHEAGFATLATSAVTGEGLADLQRTLGEGVSVLTGQSGVGKTSLLNRLDPELDLPVALVMQAARKGRHTTSSSRLIPFAFGGFVVDTPGIKEFALWDIEADELPALYPEFLELAQACRFSNCRHLDEPGCAVKEAIEAGRISGLRYRNYLQIHETLLKR